MLKKVRNEVESKQANRSFCVKLKPEPVFSVSILKVVVPRARTVEPILLVIFLFFIPIMVLVGSFQETVPVTHEGNVRNHYAALSINYLN